MFDLEHILERLAQLTPGKLLGYAWLAMLVLTLVSLVKIYSGVAAALGYLLLVGYPYLVAGGLPASIVRAHVRSIARVLFVVFLVAAAIAAVLIPMFQDPVSGEVPIKNPPPLAMAYVGVVLVAIFAPFFLATAALNDVDRVRRGGLQFGGFQHFLGLYFWMFGGIFWVHPQVRSALGTK